LRILHLPSSLSHLARKLKQKYYTRIFASIPSNIKEYNKKALYSSMAIFCHLRSELLTDDLTETLLQLIHKIRTSAEISMNKHILSEVKCVNGKFDILYKLAQVAVEHPSGIIQDTIYPKVSKEKLECLAKELMSNKNAWYEQQVQKKMVSSYSHSHRRVLLKLLSTFIFEANDKYQPILQAIKFIIENQGIKDKYYRNDKEVPALDLIENKWRTQVIDHNGDIKPKTKIHRINYEIAILEKLHSLLVCKLVWVDGAYRFRNPEEDLPKDFDLRPEYYYQLLNLPMDPKVYIQGLKDDLNENLQQLDKSILCNRKVKIVPNAKDGKVGKIKITPYDAQVPSEHLALLQQAINDRWPTISLIDILKETNFRINFTKYFPTVSSRENIDKTKLLKRLLLCIYAIGSNTGLKRISAANEDVSYTELRYIKKKFINVANVRQAIAHVINAILEIRDPDIWGTATIGCACDSTKVSSWDQNLMTQWHTRYRGRGVMIYWHVDKNSALIYSQLKTCSSSEVGSMIKGVLDHCSKMNMKETYVDTHGQSTIGFGLSSLLGFDLLPRLKNIKNQKLYYPEIKDKINFKNLEAILKSTINWGTIEKHYHDAVKHAVALKIGAVEPDVMIKHLNKDNYHHPVYQALSEIGNAEKTIFLCRYLMSEELRIEIHDALNIVERINSIMGFIFYGKLGEISTNDRDEQELAIVCLHLLQVCMVYINTLMIQEVLSDPAWRKVLLTLEDKKILTPLIHAHINPYGLFPLDLNTRVIIEEYTKILRIQV
jgi:TnpA family transposase